MNNDQLPAPPERSSWPPGAPERLVEAARNAQGFMPEDEGMALLHLAQRAAQGGIGPVVEVGAYCGRSTLFLAAGLARVPERAGACTVFSVDHHRGSEELQPGWAHHDPSLIDPVTGLMDTLPRWRATIAGAGAEPFVVGVVGDSPLVAAAWGTPLSLVFIDGGHRLEVVMADYLGWAPHLGPGGLLVFHDVFADPALGGQGPYACYQAAIASGRFRPLPDAGCNSLKALLTLPRAL